ncbi:hypothetical protein D9M68_664290 [compost metagenome]
MCWCPNTWIICRCIGSPTSMRARACPWSARPWPTGSAKRAGSCSHWSAGCGNTSWPPTKSTPTTRRSPCSPPARVKPRPDACGRMCATSAPPVVAPLRRSGLPTRRIAKASTPEPISKASPGRCKPMAMPVSRNSMPRARFTRRHAGRMPGASFSTCTRHWPRRLRLRPCNGLARYTPSRRKFADSRPINDAQCGSGEPARCWRTCTPGLTTR